MVYHTVYSIFFILYICLGVGVSYVTVATVRVNPHWKKV